MKLRTTVLLSASLAAIGALWLLWPSGPAEVTRAATATAPAKDGAPMVAVTLPSELSAQAKMGQRAFDAACSSCHGANAAGQQGVAPPLIHKTYEPGHHADMAFFLAVENGVRPHHWRFGAMPPIEGLTRADVATIVAFVREVQRENGIN